MAMIILDIHVASVIRMLFLPAPLDLMNYGVVIREWQASLSSYVFIPGKDCVSLTYICCFIYLFCPIVCFGAFSLLPWPNPNDWDNLLLSASPRRT